MTRPLRKFPPLEVFFDPNNIPPCASCKHYHDGQGDVVCPAFPEGIPDDILHYGNPHTDAFPGDHGIRYERSEDYPEIPLPPTKTPPGKS